MFCNLDLDDNRRILAIKRAIVQGGHFGESQWYELATLVNEYALVDNHPRLLRSLSFGDSDYEGCVIQVITEMAQRNKKNIDTIEAYLRDDCKIEVAMLNSTTSPGGFAVTPKVFRVEDIKNDVNLISVMMPFAKEFDDVYEAIESAAKQAYYSCKRADKVWESHEIIQDIFNLIRAAAIIVVDISGKNANVFYELGIAHTLGKEAIIISSDTDRIPFDIGHHRILKYYPNHEGFEELEKKLRDRFSSIRLKDMEY